MAKKYNLKIPEELVKIFEFYIQMEPFNRYSTISKYLNKVINDEADRILNFIRTEIKENEDMKEMLESQKYKELKKALNFDLE